MGVGVDKVGVGPNLVWGGRVATATTTATTNVNRDITITITTTTTTIIHITNITEGK